jgi:hypothetical protein
MIMQRRERDYDVNGFVDWKLNISTNKSNEQKLKPMFAASFPEYENVIKYMNRVPINQIIYQLSYDCSYKSQYSCTANKLFINRYAFIRYNQ